MLPIGGSVRPGRVRLWESGSCNRRDWGKKAVNAAYPRGSLVKGAALQDATAQTRTSGCPKKDMELQ